MMATFTQVARVATFTLSTVFLLALIGGIIASIVYGSIPLIVCLVPMLLIYVFGFYANDCVRAVKTWRGDSQ
jgi:uncharacterized membrane protein